MATAPTNRNIVIKSYMKQVHCYPKSAILPSTIGNFENPLPMSSDWHLCFSCLYGGCALEKTKIKQLEFATVYTLVTFGDKY